MAPFWHRWSDFSILNLSVFHLTDKCFAVSNLINLRTILFLEQQKNPGNLAVPGYLTFGHMVSCDTNLYIFICQSVITR